MSRLTATMTYRDLVRAYVGPDATDPECDYAWWHLCGWPSVSVKTCEQRLAEFCASHRYDPLAALRDRRRFSIAAQERSDAQRDARIARLRAVTGGRP